MLRQLCRKNCLQRSSLQSLWCTTAAAAPLRSAATTQRSSRGTAEEGAPPGSSTHARAALSAPSHLPQGPSTPPQHPMERLSFVFQHHPSALRLHRELTIALASGDASRAADLAGVLATTVQRVLTAHEVSGESTRSEATDKSHTEAPGATVDARNANTSGLPDAAQASAAPEIPAPSAEDVAEAVEKTREAVLQHAAALHSSSSGLDNELSSSDGTSTADHAPSPSSSSLLPFWRDPQCLCVTVLESAFETDVPDGEAQGTLSDAGNRAAEHEAEQVRILEAYLEKEGARWKAQKAAIAKIVLDVARSLKLTPEDLQSTEGLATGDVAPSGEETRTGGKKERRLNVLRHSNLVIRGELPTSAAALSATSNNDDVEAQLAALEERMRSLGTPLTHAEAQMARHELQMAQSKMRYVVGVHKELQTALDSSASVKKVLQQRQQQRSCAETGASSSPSLSVASEAIVAEPSGTQLFMDEVIRALNEGAEAFSVRMTTQKLPLTVEDTSAREAAENPVLPFTFMLKCCLWFDNTPSAR